MKFRQTCARTRGETSIDMDVFRSSFQPTEKRDHCSGGEVLYDGYCFIPALRELVQQYTSKQLMITGILIVPPEWARRGNTECKQRDKNFCSPDDATEFGRFAGFLAWYFNGQNGHGRISEFVIMNEVNAAEWYNTGCGGAKACNVDKWVRSYAQVYNAAYDRIRSHQRQAPVLISFQHDFGSELDHALAPLHVSVTSHLHCFVTIKVVASIGCLC